MKLTLLCLSFIFGCSWTTPNFKVLNIDSNKITDYHYIELLSLENLDTINVLSSKIINKNFREKEKIVINKKYYFDLKEIKKLDYEGLNVRESGNTNYYIDGHLIVSHSQDVIHYKAVNLKDLYIAQE